MTNTELEQLREEIRKLLQKRIMAGQLAEFMEDDFIELFQSHEAQIKQDIFKKVKGILPNCDNCPGSWSDERDAYAHIGELAFQNKLTSSLKALEEKEIG